MFLKDEIKEEYFSKSTVLINCLCLIFEIEEDFEVKTLAFGTGFLGETHFVFQDRRLQNFNLFLTLF